MARLIDAEQVKQYALTEGFYCDTDADKEATAEEIDQLFPTVKAIPIEWIKNVWLKNPNNQGTIEFFPQPTFEDVMGWLIEDWEKENETN